MISRPGSSTSTPGAPYTGVEPCSAGAAAMLAEVLHDARRTFGRQHPFMLKARRSHARWRMDAGEAVSATELNELVEAFLRMRGPDHPKTLRTMDNLARCQVDTP